MQVKLVMMMLKKMVMMMVMKMLMMGLKVEN